jgi:hypothetical protein
MLSEFDRRCNTSQIEDNGIELEVQAEPREAHDEIHQKLKAARE